jgi:hypothetical protein
VRAGSRRGKVEGSAASRAKTDGGAGGGGRREEEEMLGPEERAREPLQGRWSVVIVIVERWR